jgi:hypothetical protein
VISKSTSQHLSQSSLTAEISRLLPPETLSLQGPHSTAPSARHPSQTSDLHEVIIGPNTISGRFILLATNRRHTGLTSDELTLRLRVVSLAVADLVTPYQSAMLEVRAPGQAPIQPHEFFSHPVAADNSREDEITFTVPSNLDLDHSTLVIHDFIEAKAIPLDLPIPTSPHKR